MELNIAELLMRTKEGKVRATAEQIKQEKEADEAAKKEKEKFEELRRIKIEKTVEYITKAIYKQADEGKNSYTYSFGEYPNKDIVKGVKEYFQNKLKVVEDYQHERFFSNYAGHEVDVKYTVLKFNW